MIAEFVSADGTLHTLLKEKDDKEKEDAKKEVITLLEESGLKNFTEPIGKFISKGEKIIEVKK